MRPLAPTLSALLTTLCLLTPCPAFAADSTPAPVSLPPLVVEEGRPWLYAQADGTEYLSRCSERTTRDYIESGITRMQWVRALIPPEFLLKTDVPAVSILLSQSQAPSSTQQEIAREVVDHQNDPIPRLSHNRALTAPNLLLTDTEACGAFVYIDEALVRPENLIIASDYVRHLLDRRTPTLPLWLREGIMCVYDDLWFTEPPLAVKPLVWRSREPGATGQAAEITRKILPLDKILLNPARLPAPLPLSRAVCGLLVRWALDPGPGVPGRFTYFLPSRGAFWAFAARTAEEPVTEELIKTHFNTSFAELRVNLMGYMPRAEFAQLDLPFTPTPTPPVKVRLATPTEIARLRGEWERLSVPFVRANFPATADRYLAQARRTLHRTDGTGERDPRLVASLGLLELDSGHIEEARPLLTAAAFAGVIRPRVYTELARLRWADLIRDQPPTRQFTAEEAAPIFGLLTQSLRQSPDLAANFTLLADLWLRTSQAPTDAELVQLRRATGLLCPDSASCLRIATALIKHHRTAAAKTLLTTAAPYVPDATTREEFIHLYATLAKTP